MSICDRSDLQTLGSQPMRPKNLPNHCIRYVCQAMISVQYIWYQLASASFRSPHFWINGTHEWAVMAHITLKAVTMVFLGNGELWSMR